MMQVRSVLLMILAVLALASPSLAVGVTAASASEVSVVAAEDRGAAGYRPCEMQGGKRVLPCQPDLGLLVRATAERPWTTAAAPRPVPDLMLPDRAPQTDPPPPRRG
ncbi:MAG TPA: hypothetical protein VGN80_05820 [Devosiaceae bacterium]|nr:hypothetical protein [Devosiaceae bacterium]